MKRYLFLLLALSWGTTNYAQTFDVDTLRFSGNINDRINFVILGDGYTENELDQFAIDANDFTDEFFSQTPFAEYQDYFNVFMIKVPSNESGASHPGTATDVSEPLIPVVENVDNYFGSTFDAFGIHRLLVAENSIAINTVLANNFPLYDQVLILTNSPYYGGSGGTFAVSSVEASANEIAIHEIGHSFSQLADEYWAGSSFANERINMTQETDPSEVKWTNWMNDNGVGIYQHGGTGLPAQWYRPHQNCKMRFLGSPFCSVCTEGIIEKIHTLVSPIDDYSPDNTVNQPSFPIQLKLDLIHPIPNTLKSKWTINGVEFINNQDSITLNEANLSPGTNQVLVIVEDTTSLQRIDNHGDIHTYLVNWTIENTMVDIKEITSSINELNINVFPNPTTDQVEIQLKSSEKIDLEIEVITMDGKIINTTSMQKVEKIMLDFSKYLRGNYILNFKLGKTSIATKKIQKL